ncbi:PepSY-associated TM helix domain-containing protein [Aliikangiella sp. IMCC44632]
MKKALRKIHFLVTLASGVFLINLSLTGVLLVYAQDIQRWINPQYWTVKLPKKAPNNFDNPEKIASLAVNFQKQNRVLIKRIYLEENPTFSWRFALESGDYVSINPYTGEQLLRYEYSETLYSFVMQWHRWLLLKSDDGSYPFRNIISIASLLMCINLIVGVWLWIKRKNRWRNLKPVVKGKLQLILLRFHNLFGVVFVLPLFFIALTGIAFNWSQPIKYLVEAVTMGNVMSGEPPKLSIEKTLPLDELNFSLAIRNAKQALPEGQIHRIYLPTKPTDSIRFRVKLPAEPHPYSWVWVNPVNQQVLNVFNAVDSNVATRVWNFRYSFHIGRFIHPAMEWLWSFIALLPTLFVVSGITLYLMRRNKKQR